jgi:putative oxidoreductase
MFSLTEALSKRANKAYALMRIITGFLFLWHGTQKLFDVPMSPPPQIPTFVVYVAGPIELIGGLLVMIGLFTEWAAFLCSGLMAVAYWKGHGMQALLPIQNMGELAALYCFVFLCISSYGSGVWSVEAACWTTYSKPPAPKATSEPREEKIVVECQNKWKLDVNDRYQKAVGVVVSLSTAALTLPIFFLKDIVDKKGLHSIAQVLSLSVYLGWVLLSISVLSGIIYYFCSAKWVKLAWGQRADIFCINVTEVSVERMLDVSYFLMMTGFLGGVFSILEFVVTFSVNN